MKKYILLTILFFSIPTIVKSQDSIPSLKERIVGRWIETSRIEGENVKTINEYADTYIFKDNMVFHKGEASEGVILFNIAGRYMVENNDIVIYYRDYMQKNASNKKAIKLVFKVLTLSENKMHVIVQDYDYEYQMVLSR